MRALLGLLLLLATTVQAQEPAVCTPRAEEAPNGRRSVHYTCSQPPTGLQLGNPGDTATVPGTPVSYVCVGVAPSTTCWQNATGTVAFCGDQSINQGNEACDVVGGVGAQGVCTSLADCIEPGEGGAPCTCASASTTCGNGMVDAGEGCDINFAGEDPPCPGQTVVNGMAVNRCTQDCRCIAVCQNGTIDTGTTSGVDENCEFTSDTGGTGGVDFGGAYRGIPVSGGPAASGSLDTNLEATGNVDITSQEAIIEGLILPENMANTSRILHKGALSPGANGWNVHILGGGSAGQIRVAADNGTSTTTCASSIGALTVGICAHFAILIDDGVCEFRVREIGATCNAATPIDAQHDDVTSDNSIHAVWGNAGTELGIGGSASSGADPLTGYLDELRIWTCADAGTCVATYRTSIMEQEWDNEVTGNLAGVTLTARYDFDQTLTTPRVEDTISGVDADPVAAVALASSPFSTGSGGGGGGTPTEFGCTLPQTCNPTSCRCQDPGSSTGRTFYVATTGNNSNSGLSTSAPWATVTWALQSGNPSRLQPGDTLIVRDGTYTHDVSIVGGSAVPALTSDGTCDGVNATALCGTSSAPITIRAENSGLARWDGDGVDAEWTLIGLAHYVIDGITIEQDDAPGEGGNNDHNMSIVRSSDLLLKNMLFNRNMRCGNNSLLKMDDVQDVTCERCEFWRHGRHGFSVSGGRRVFCDRCYGHNNTGTTGTAPYGQCPGGVGCPANCTTTGGSDSGTFLLYPCNNCAIVNSVAEGAWGGSNPSAPGALEGLRTADNWIVNTILWPRYGIGTGFKVYSRNNENPIRGNLRGTYRDFTCIDPNGICVKIDVAEAALVDRTSVWVLDGANPGLTVANPGADPSGNSQADCSQVSNSCSVTITNSIIQRNSGTAVSISDASAGTQTCTLGTGGTGNRIEGGSASCSVCDCTTGTPFSRAMPAGIGTTGTCCYHGSTSFGADNRCLYNAATRTKLTGTANNMFCPTTATAGCSGATGTCTGTTAQGVSIPCINGIRWCPNVVTGINDVDGCRTAAHRWMRQLAGDTQCGSATVCNGAAINLDCP